MDIQAKIMKNTVVVDEFTAKVESADSISSLLSALISAKQKTNEILTDLVNADKLDPPAARKLSADESKGMCYQIGILIIVLIHYICFGFR